jgi:hypothetical protein
MSNASTADGLGHADARDDEESGAPILFPREGNFSAVVPLSEVGNVPESYRVAPTPVEANRSLVARGAARDGQDEHEEVTLVPGRVGRPLLGRKVTVGRPSWPITIAALTLSVAAGLTAGAYLIKSGRPVEMQTPAAVAEDVSTEAVGATLAPAPQPTAVASESRLIPSPPREADPGTDMNTTAVDAGAGLDKTGRDLSIPKRGSAVNTPPGQGGRSTEASSARLTIAEKPSERPDRKGPSVTSNPPAKREAVTTRRATGVVEHPLVLRAPERSLPVSTPPAATKSKKVIQWP